MWDHGTNIFLYIYFDNFVNVKIIIYLSKYITLPLFYFVYRTNASYVTTLENIKPASLNY